MCRLELCLGVLFAKPGDKRFGVFKLHGYKKGNIARNVVCFCKLHNLVFARKGRYPGAFLKLKATYVT